MQLVHCSLFFLFNHLQTPVDVRWHILSGQFSATFSLLRVRSKLQKIFFEEFQVIVQILITQHDQRLELEHTLLFLLNILHDLAHVCLAVQHLLHGCLVDSEPISALVNLAQKGLGQFVFVAVEHFLAEQIKSNLGQRASVPIFDEEPVQIAEHTCEYLSDYFEVIPLGGQDC